MATRSDAWNKATLFLEILGNLLRMKNTINEYMQQLMDVKSDTIDEGIDYKDASDLDTTKWLSYRISR